MQQEHGHAKYPTNPANSKQCISAEEAEYNACAYPKVNEEGSAADHDIAIGLAHGAGTGRDEINNQ